MNTHDINSPSRLAMREICPASAYRETVCGSEEVRSSASERGTMLHDAARAFLGGESLDSMHLCDGDRNAVRFGVDTVRSMLPPASDVYTEEMLDLSHLGISHGTADVVVVGGNVAAVIDYKFGEVAADWPQYNLQLMAYALGVQKKYGASTITGCIIQPELYDRGMAVRSHTWTGEELALAELRIIGIVNATRNPDAPTVKGDHCSWCRGKATCPAWSGAIAYLPSHLSITDHFRDLSPVSRGKILDKIKEAKRWCVWAEEEIIRLGVDGMEIDGYEVAPGRSSRSWASEEKALLAVSSLAVSLGVSPSECVSPAKLLSVAKVEKLLGKSAAVRAGLEGQIVVAPGALTLAKKVDGHDKE